MTDQSMHRDLGRLEGRMAAVESQVSTMSKKVDQIHQAMMQAAGGWRVLLAVGTVAAALGAGLVKLAAVIWR